MAKIEVSKATFADLKTVYAHVVTNSDFATANWLSTNRIPMSSARLLVTAKIATECAVTGTIYKRRHSAIPTLLDVFLERESSPI